MRSIEDLRETFISLPFARNRLWTLETLVSARLHLSRGESGEFSIFLEGELQSFGPLPAVDGVQHTEELTALPSGASVAALHIRSTDQINGASAMAHIAYELICALDQSPVPSNRELIRQIHWILPLIGQAPGMLSPERQRGLIGECLFLRELLLRARTIGRQPNDVLDRWWGHSPAKRDFAAVGIGIEVKTTTYSSRQHQIGSIEQLEPQVEGEKIFLYSVGLKVDPSSSRKLPIYVDEVEQLLVSAEGAPIPSAIETFRRQLRGYGYNVTRRTLYDTEPGYIPAFEVPGALFREAELDRLRRISFVEARLPSMVTSVSYVLNITCEQMSKLEVDATVLQLLTAAAFQQF